MSNALGNSTHYGPFVYSFIYIKCSVYSSHSRTTPVNPHHGIKTVKEEPNSQKLRSDQVFKEKQPVRLNTQLPASVA